VAKYLNKNVWYITDQEMVPAVLSACMDCSAIGLDTETTRRRDLPDGFTWREDIFKPGLDPYVSEVRLLQLSTFTDIYVIDLWYCPDISAFAALFMSESILKIGMNLKFDIKMLMRQFGFDFRYVFDLMLVSQTLYNGKPQYFLRHSLYEIIKRELGITLNKDLQASNWGAPVLSMEQINYAAVDVDVLHDACLALAAKLRDPTIIVNTRTKAYLDLWPTVKLENNACIATARLELDGVYVDHDLWDIYDLEVRVKFTETLTMIREMTSGLGITYPKVKGKPNMLNLESPKQLKQVFSVMGYELESTDADTLEELGRKCPFAAVLSEYRSLAKLLSSYGNGIPGKERKKNKNGEAVYFIERIHPITGRIHASFGQLHAATGRYNCDRPNIQNVVGMDKAKFRKAFTGELIRGIRNVFIIADLEQFETRALCSIAKDRNLKSVILDRSTDTHTRTAAMMYHVDESTIITRGADGHKVKGPNAWMRAAAKSIAFGEALPK